MDTTNTAPGDKLIRLDTFDTAVAVDPSAEDDAKRRFMTLILQTAYRDGGNIGHVLRATNTSGEVFAVKLLKDNAILSGQAPDRSAEQAAAHLANTAALFEEYRHLCTVSHLRGFPRVYGYGSCEDDPLILMEWVEGTSLKQALPLLPHDASGGLTTQMVAAVGNAVLRALLMTKGLVNPVVHRDLSPANIMFRTTSRTLEQQIVDCSFDPCLIDMGSATMALGDDTITRRADIWRFATPAYAAPEMLTQDIEGIAALRRSPAVDVYALSSILYQLYSGRKPFDFESTDAAATGSFYLVKTKTKPAPLEPRCNDDEALVQIIMKGISIEQCDRPTEQQMLEVLSAYLTDAESEGREGAGDEAAIDIDSGTHLKVDVAGERAREILEQARHDADTGQDAGQPEGVEPQQGHGQGKGALAQAGGVAPDSDLVALRGAGRCAAHPDAQRVGAGGSPVLRHDLAAPHGVAEPVAGKKAVQAESQRRAFRGHGDQQVAVPRLVDADGAGKHGALPGNDVQMAGSGPHEALQTVHKDEDGQPQHKGGQQARAALAFFEGRQCLPEGKGGVAHGNSLEEEGPSGKPAASASGPGPKRRGRRAAGFSGGECQRTIPRRSRGCSSTRQ